MDKTQFEWQADQDEDLGSSAQQTKRNPGRRRWWFILALLLFLVAASALTAQILSRKQGQLEENVRQEVRVSFNLWQEAVERKDSELYAFLLAADDGNWQRTQKRLFEKGLILDRSFLGLTVQPDASAAVKIELAPDWQRATVSFEQLYAVAANSDSDGMVRLLHTAVYEMRDSTWLQVPLDETFWGEWQTDEGELLIVHYPARDASLAQRISRQLEADLRAVCSEPSRAESAADDSCQRIKPLILKMSTEVVSLDALDSAAGPMLFGGVYQLPAPTLVGLPMDELSYHVFYQGYTRKLIEDVRAAVSSPIYHSSFTNSQISSYSSISNETHP